MPQWLITTLQVFSPIIILLTIGWQVGHWWILRNKQKSAIVDICRMIATLPDPANTFHVIRHVNELKAAHDFYEKVVFGNKAPLGLMSEIVRMNALVEGVLTEWTIYKARATALSAEQKDVFQNFREEARALADRASIVLYSL